MSEADQRSLQQLPDVRTYAASDFAASSVPPPSHSPEQHARNNWEFPGGHPTSNMRGGWPPQQQPFEERSNSNIAPELAYDERMGVEFLLDGKMQPAKLNNGATSQNGSQIEACSTLPRNTEPTCPLDRLLRDFLAEQRRMHKEGVPNKTLVGPPYPNFSPLINPATSQFSHPLSRVMTDILRTFPDLHKMPELVAVMYIMFLVMRWCVEPTQENYERLPEWVRPRPSQLFTPHPIWVDYLPW